MKRPLVIVTALYAAGVLAADHVRLPLAWLFSVALLLGWLSVLWPAARPVLLWPLLALTGWTSLAWRTAVLAPADLRAVQAERIEYVTLRGQICASPAQQVFVHDGEESLRTVAPLDVLALKPEGGDWRTVAGQVSVATPGVLPANYFKGQTVEVTGVLRRPRGALAEGLFDYRAYLERQGIYYQLNARSAADWQIPEPPAPLLQAPFSDRFLAWGQRSLALGLPAEDEPLRLQWAMALGWKTALTDEVSEPFMRSGTMHIFAISGMHIALIATILVGLLRVVRLPRVACGAVIIPLIWFYTAATGWQASAIRSTIMTTVIVVGWSLNRPSDLVNSLAAAALIILIWDPQQLFQASFQLSFFVVLSIALLLPPLEQQRQRLLRTDPLLPPELRPRWQQRLDSPLRHVTMGLATSLAAWLGSLPLIAHYFHLFTPVSLLANVLVVPLSGLALTSSLGSLLTAEWLPAATVLFNHCGWFLMACMTRISTWAACLPGGAFYVATPPLWLIMGYYGTLLAAFAGWPLRRDRRLWFAGLAGLTGSGFAVAVWLARSRTELHVLPLGGGQAIFFRAPGKTGDWLLDCGHRNSAEFVVVPFLRARGLDRLSHLVLTHGDARHVGGARHVIEQLSPRTILLNELPSRSPSYRDLQSRWTDDPLRWRSVSRGAAMGPWEVLHPAESDRFGQADDAALVLRGEFTGTRVLLLSDLGIDGQNRLCERHTDLRADIVVTGLPTHGEPLGDGLLDLVQPRLIVVVDAAVPATARTLPAVRERLAKRSVPVIYGSVAGAVALRFHATGWTVTTPPGTQPAASNVNPQPAVDAGASAPARKAADAKIEVEPRVVRSY